MKNSAIEGKEIAIRKYLDKNFDLYGVIPVSLVPFGEYIAAYAKRITKNPLDSLQTAKSIIVVAKCTTYEEDVFKTSFITNSYKGYIDIYVASNQLKTYLKSLEVRAVIEHDLDQKACAILAGLGWRGKNTLVVNKKYGTHLRFDTVVTDLAFSEYSSIVENECGECNLCVKACPHGCFAAGKLDKDKCFKKYLPKKRMNIINPIPMCAECQKGCLFNIQACKWSER